MLVSDRVMGDVGDEYKPEADEDPGSPDGD
jgi:hypothetical protein